jgi:hypothetical protein
MQDELVLKDKMERSNRSFRLLPKETPLQFEKKSGGTTIGHVFPRTSGNDRPESVASSCLRIADICLNGSQDQQQC